MRKDTDTYLEGILNCIVCMTVVAGWAVGLAVLALAASEFLVSIPEVREFLLWIRV